MRLLKTHSHTSERLGYEARKTRRKVVEGNADTTIRQTTLKNLPRTASVARGRDEKDAMIRQTIVKNLPRKGSVAGGGEAKKGELKENARPADDAICEVTRRRHRVSPCRSAY